RSRATSPSDGSGATRSRTTPRARACRSTRSSAGSAPTSAMCPFRGRKLSIARTDSSHMSRRLGLIGVVIAALAAASAAFAGDPRAPQHRFNPADQAWAQRIMVQHGDLGAGDWRVQQLDNQGDANAPANCKNPNLSDLVLTGQAKNP